jgi:hypothetical protein
MSHLMEIPEAFVKLISDMADPAVEKVASNLGMDTGDYFLDYGLTDLKAQKQLGTYLDYVLAHKDSRERGSALWRELDKVGAFGGVTRELKFFARMRDAIRRRQTVKPRSVKR